MEKAPIEKMGDRMVPQVYLACWTRPRVLKGLGEQVCGSAGGQVSIGGSWNQTIYGKGTSTPDLPG